jgi:uncharacterized protein (TIGR03067 family)
MRYRVAAGLVAVLGLTAFAPAPFVKPTKKEPPARLEGVWRVVSRNNWKMSTKGPVKARVRIEPGKWHFEREAAASYRSTGSYFLKVDASASPPTFDLRRNEDDAEPYGCGVFELKGDELRVAYSWSATRPDGLNSKKAHVYHMTLQRMK